jgi:sec-independent protein translocase protein TatC
MDKAPEAPLSPEEPYYGYGSGELGKEEGATPKDGSSPQAALPATTALVKASEPPAPNEDEEEGGPVKTFLEHLEDLRWVIIRVVAVVAIAMVGCMVGAPAITQFLEWPLLLSGATRPDGLPIQLQPLGPLGPFLITMKLALYGGIVIALPFVLYFIADYVMPALKKHEKRFFLRAFIVGAGLFLLGVMLCYFFALPMTLRATIQYSQWMGFTVELWRAEEYFSFVTLLMVCMGASFEIPILVLSLVKIGLIQLEWLTKGRPYFFVITFAVVAFITPDFVSTFFLVVPMMVLMEICIWIARYWKRKELKEALQAKGGD